MANVVFVARGKCLSLSLSLSLRFAGLIAYFRSPPVDRRQGAKPPEATIQCSDEPRFINPLEGETPSGHGQPVFLGGRFRRPTRDSVTTPVWCSLRRAPTRDSVTTPVWCSLRRDGESRTLAMPSRSDGSIGTSLGSLSGQSKGKRESSYDFVVVIVQTYCDRVCCD